MVLTILFTLFEELLQLVVPCFSLHRILSTLLDSPLELVLLLEGQEERLPYLLFPQIVHRLQLPFRQFFNFRISKRFVVVPAE